MVETHSYMLSPFGPALQFKNSELRYGPSKNFVSYTNVTIFENWSFNSKAYLNCCELTLLLTSFKKACQFSKDAFFTGAHLCNRILAVSYNLYIQ